MHHAEMMHKNIDSLPALVRLLQVRGLSQRRIAEGAEIDQATISRLSRGAVTNVSFRAAERLLVMAGGKVVWPEPEAVKPNAEEARDAA